MGGDIINTIRQVHQHTIHKLSICKLSIYYLYIKAYKNQFGNSSYSVNTESSMTEDHSIHIS